MTVVGELCARFGYPVALRDLLEDVVASARADVPDIRALVLSGSVATGDFVWRDDGDGSRFLSDIDLLVFSRHGAPCPAFRERLGELERRHASPLFEIDAAVSSIADLRRMPERYQFVEARLAGAAPIGAEFLEYFPDRFDRRAARQSFFGNVWKGVLHWPGPAAADDEIYRLALARMLLDLPLLALSESGRCIPSHAARVAAFAELPASHPLASPEFEAIARAGLRMRTHGDVGRAELEAGALRAIDALCDLFDGRGGVGTADARLAARIEGLLPPRSLRRLAGELRAAVLVPGLLLRDPLWWWRCKEAVGGAALLGLLQYAFAGAEGAPPSGVTSMLRAYTGGEAPLGTGVDYVADARRLYWLGRRRLYPHAARKQPEPDPK